MMQHERIEITISNDGKPTIKYIYATHIKKRKWWQFWKAKTYSVVESASTALSFPIDKSGIVIDQYHIRKLTTFEDDIK